MRQWRKNFFFTKKMTKFRTVVGNRFALNSFKNFLLLEEGTIADIVAGYDNSSFTNKTFVCYLFQCYTIILKDILRLVFAKRNSCSKF